MRFEVRGTGLQRNEVQDASRNILHLKKSYVFTSNKTCFYWRLLNICTVAFSTLPPNGGKNFETFTSKDSICGNCINK